MLDDLPPPLPSGRRRLCHKVYNAIQSIRIPKTIPLIACILQGAEPEIETGKGAGSPVADPTRLVAFTMLIERRLKGRYSSLGLNIEGLKISSKI